MTKRTGSNRESMPKKWEVAWRHWDPSKVPPDLRILQLWNTTSERVAREKTKEKRQRERGESRKEDMSGDIEMKTETVVNKYKYGGLFGTVVVL